MLINTLSSDDRLGKPWKPKVSAVLHRIACIYGALIAIVSLFMLVLFMLDAELDVHTYGHTGTFSYYLYFWDKYGCLEQLCTLLLVIAEFRFYFAQFHSAKNKEVSRGSIWYFAAIMVLHIIICLHANSIPVPDSFPFTETADAVLSYRLFANVTVSPTVGYFVSYLSRMYMVRSTRSI